jgi:hypothetical protein
MGGARCILTGFAVGVMLGVAGFWAAGSGRSVPNLSRLDHATAPRAVEASTVLTNYAGGNKTVLEGQLSRSGILTIQNEPGGYITDYAMRMMQWRAKGISVRFTGSCDSACTLYLALPYEQTCITEGASFRFHAPIAETQHARRLAEEYMLNTYPVWVRAWIEAMGGLTDELIRMDYQYAENYMQICEQDGAEEVLLTERSTALHSTNSIE